MKCCSRALRFCLGLLLSPIPALAGTNTGVHTTWLWHLHQPIYWPDRRVYGLDHYENAWDTIQQQNAGRSHPSPEVLSTIFGQADRVNVYQGEIESTLGALLAYPNAGAQVNYSGALMENVQSLAAAGQLGYADGWSNSFRTARSWTTTSGKPRLDLVNFTYHHAIAPLLDDATLEMELRIQQRQMEIFWGTNVPRSRGYFPAETCFSEHIIPVLNRVGIAWTVVANNHLARSCADFPLALGSGGENCDIPNPADQIDPAQGATNYQRVAIERGCAPTQVMPFGFQPHYARYVDPNSGQASTTIVVPSDQVLSWRDSYGTWDLGMIAPIAARNNPAHPSLVLCAHDGDNAWSGGYSYYNEWVPQMANTAASDGYEPTTVEQFISDFPPNTNDIVHVEDGGWVFADGDFGSPSFINWNWPPSYTDGSGNTVVDPSVGTTDKGDNWRVIVATENRVETAQQISNITPDLDQVRDPGCFGGTPNAIELGWHYCLAGLDSGFVYYGCNGDECLRAIVAQSNACRNVDAVIAANPAADRTPPTVFQPQRSPWNPGATNFGVEYGYRMTVATNTDFWVWTYAYDASGITNVSLLFRNNGTNPPTSDQFKIYAGGPLAGAWQTAAMTRRVTPPVSGYTAEYIADYYYTKVTGISNAFVDYYVSASDNCGNVYKSPIQHVWVGSGNGSSGGQNPGAVVSVSPAPPAAGSAVTIQYVATGRILGSAGQVYLHLGWNNWNPIVSPDAAMTFNSASNWWQCTVSVLNTATNLNCCFNNGSGTWDNNNGANWNFAISSHSPSQPPAQPQALAATPVQTNQINLSWSLAPGANGYIVDRDDSPIATTAVGNYSDIGLAIASYHCYSITATNSVGFSTPSAVICTNTLAPAPTNVPPFLLDGTFDYPGYLLATNGSMALYAAVRGTTLYVATRSPGTSGPNDNFIFVSDQLLSGAGAPAPWAKAGTVAVATTQPYLASESQNTYISWYANGAQTTWPCAKGATPSGAMEGTMDLVQAFGYLPTNIYLCAAAYVTTNGGPLVGQCPPGSGPDIESNEFLVIPVAALRDSVGNGTFDLLDPARGFKLLGAQIVPAGVVLTWASMPGHGYQVVNASALNDAWGDLSGASNFAGPLQLILSYTDAIPTGTSQRLYRVKLLP